MLRKISFGVVVSMLVVFASLTANAQDATFIVHFDNGYVADYSVGTASADLASDQNADAIVTIGKE